MSLRVIAKSSTSLGPRNLAKFSLFDDRLYCLESGLALLGTPELAEGVPKREILRHFSRMLTILEKHSLKNAANKLFAICNAS